MTVDPVRLLHRSSEDRRGSGRTGGTLSAPTASTISVVALGGLIAVHLLAPKLLGAVAPVLAVTGLLVGLPHGAVDHMVPFWVTGERATVRRLAQVLVSYLVIAAVAAAALLIAPAAVVVVFLVVSGLHFGRGDVAFAAERAARPVPHLHEEVPAVLAHGAVVIALPLVLWPESSLPVLGQLAPALVDPLGRALPAVGLATAAVVLAAVVDLARRGRRTEVVELAVLVAAFAVVPPLAAFGVYFGLWHAGRHTSRMVTLAAGAAPAGAGRAWAVRRYALHAAAPTAVALAVIIAISRTDDAEVLVTELAVLLALTFPHVQTVARLDAAPRSG